MKATERSAMLRAGDVLKRVCELFEHTDAPLGIAADGALIELSVALAAAQPPAHAESAAEARRQERKRAEMVLLGLGPDSGLANEHNNYEAFYAGFGHCRQKALAILRDGAESYEPVEERQAGRGVGE